MISADLQAVGLVSEAEGVRCLVCYDCQVCVSCEKYGGPRGQIPPHQQRGPMPAPAPQPQPVPAQLFSEEDIKRVVKEAVLEALIQLGLVKPPERQRVLK